MKKNAKDILKKSLATIASTAMIFSLVFVHMPTKVMAATEKITLGAINNQLVYVKQGETLQLHPVDAATNQPVDVTYTPNSQNGFISVDENGLVRALKTSTKNHDYTQIKVTSTENPNASTWVNIVVPRTASIGNVAIVGSNGYDRGGFENFKDGGYVSDNAQHKYSLNIKDWSAEWHNFESRGYTDTKGLPVITWSVNGGKETVEQTKWQNYQSHGNGPAKDPAFYDTGKLAYGTHTAKAVLKGYDGSTDEAQLTFTNIPVWTNGAVVTKITANTGKVEIPEVINGNTITKLEGNGVPAGVTELTIPATVTSINSPNFFTNASDLEKLVFKGDAPGGEVVDMPENSVYVEVGIGYVGSFKETLANWKLGGRKISEVLSSTPVAEQVTYSNDGAPAQEIIVTVQMNVTCKNLPTGWSAVAGQEYTYQKTYAENATEAVTFESLTGKTGTVNITVNDVDTTAPTVDANAQSSDGKATVTLTSEEEIKDIVGWTRVDGCTLSKEYTEDGDYTVTVSDIAGNTTEVSFYVDVTAPGIALDDESCYFGTDMTVIDDKALAEVKINGEVQSFVTGTMWEKRFEGMTETETEYVIVVKDAAGNETTAKVVVKAMPAVDDVELGEEWAKQISDMRAELDTKEEAGYFADAEELAKAKAVVEALEDRYNDLLTKKALEDIVGTFDEITEDNVNSDNVGKLDELKKALEDKYNEMTENGSKDYPISKEYLDEELAEIEELKGYYKDIIDAYKEVLEVVDEVLGMELPIVVVPDLEEMVDELEALIKEAGDNLTTAEKEQIAERAEKVQDKIDELNDGKKALQDKIDELDKLPVDKYTDISVKAMKDAIKEAQEVANDKLSTAKDYKDALAKLETAGKGLKLKVTETDKKPADKKNDTAVKTGDTTPIMLWIVMGMLAVVVAFTAMRKRKLG